MNLDEIRLDIDRIDAQLVALFEERMEVAARVAEFKIANNMQVLDAAREKVKIDKVMELAKNEDNKEPVAELFETLLKLSRERQQSIIDREKK